MARVIDELVLKGHQYLFLEAGTSIDKLMVQLTDSSQTFCNSLVDTVITLGNRQASQIVTHR
jgi:hypothetical protein